MKIKLDFVTNSSSCCFLISSPERITKTKLSEKGLKPSVINSFTCINTIESLIGYVDCEPCDWIKKATGPHKFWGASEQSYHISKKIIEEGNFVLYVDIERNMDDVEKFERTIIGMDCKILQKDYD